MKRSALVYVMLTVMLVGVLVCGCRSAAGTSAATLHLAENDVTLAQYEVGDVATSLDSLGIEVTMPFWFIAGK